MKNRKMILYISAIIMLAAVISWFVMDALVLKVGSSSVHASFIDLAFGKTENVVIIGEVTIYKFSFINTLTLVLLIVTMILPIMASTKKKGLLNTKSDSLIMIILSVAIMVLVLLVKTFVVTDINLKDYNLDMGVYVVAGLSVLNAVLHLLVGFFK